MVSIENIQKKNKLSKELKKHGFALDFSDAYLQAEQIYNRNLFSPEVEIAKPSSDQQQHKIESDIMEELHSRIDQLERHKQMSKKKEMEYQEKISKIVDKFNEMVKSINLIEMNQLSFQRQLNTAKKSLQENTQDAQSVPAPEAEEKKKMTEPIDRNGVAPADVSVESIFYSGPK